MHQNSTTPKEKNNSKTKGQKVIYFNTQPSFSYLQNPDAQKCLKYIQAKAHCVEDLKKYTPKENHYF